MDIPKGDFPNSFYRVSLKAVIKNNKGQVLVVKEKGSDWTLPGGGIDFGEDVVAGLKRELYEEVLITHDFTAEFIGVDSFYVENKKRWGMWLVYDVMLEEGYAYGIGEDADDVAFMSIDDFKDRQTLGGHLTYKWAQNSRL